MFSLCCHNIRAEDTSFIVSEQVVVNRNFAEKWLYCLIVQYCEYHPHYEKAKEWIAKNLSDDMRDMYLGGKWYVMLCCTCVYHNVMSCSLYVHSWYRTVTSCLFMLQNHFAFSLHPSFAHDWQRSQGWPWTAWFHHIIADIQLSRTSICPWSRLSTAADDDFTCTARIDTVPGLLWSMCVCVCADVNPIYITNWTVKS